MKIHAETHKPILLCSTIPILHNTASLKEKYYARLRLRLFSDFRYWKFSLNWTIPWAVIALLLKEHKKIRRIFKLTQEGKGLRIQEQKASWKITQSPVTLHYLMIYGYSLIQSSCFKSHILRIEIKPEIFQSLQCLKTLSQIPPSFLNYCTSKKRN